MKEIEITHEEMKLVEGLHVFNNSGTFYIDWVENNNGNIIELLCFEYIDKDNYIRTLEINLDDTNMSFANLQKTSCIYEDFILEEE